MSSQECACGWAKYALPVGVSHCLNPKCIVYRSWAKAGYKLPSAPCRPQWSLLPASIASVVDVLTQSQQKHPNDEWRGIDATRHFDSAMRHIMAWKNGTKTDPESGLHHLAHAATRLLFMIAIEQTNKGEPER